MDYCTEDFSFLLITGWRPSLFLVPWTFPVWLLASSKPARERESPNKMGYNLVEYDQGHTILSILVTFAVFY